MIRKDGSQRLFEALGYTYVVFMCIVCLLPFWLLVAASFTSERAIITHGYGLLPAEFSLEAYRLAVGTSVSVLRSYMVSIGVTATGTALGLTIMVMAAYVLTRKEFRYRGKFAFYFYFTMLFSGGMVPFYILITKYFGWTNNYLSLVVPGLATPWLLLLLRNFVSTLPDSIIESAKIDGASDYTVLLRLVVPLSKPGLATIGLFLGLQYWNDWFRASLFIRDPLMFPLQYFLQNIIMRGEFVRQMMLSGMTFGVDTPTESLKMATAVIATGPIVFCYPFVQKYFVKGLTVGAVKG